MTDIQNYNNTVKFLVYIHICAHDIFLCMPEQQTLAVRAPDQRTKYSHTQPHRLSLCPHKLTHAYPIGLLVHSHELPCPP